MSYDENKMNSEKTDISEENSDHKISFPQSEKNSQNKAEPKVKSSKKGAPIVYIIICAVVALVIGVGAFLLLSGNGDKDNPLGDGPDEKEEIKCEHVEGEWIIDIESTCSAVGKKHTVCTLCSQRMNEEDVEMLPHDNIIYEGKTPNCDEGGWDEYTVCQVCEYSTFTDLPPKHDMNENNVCLTCNSFIVTCKEDFLTIGEKKMGANIRLACDIDLEGAVFTPFGIQTNEFFQGNFNGCGYTVSNFKIESFYKNGSMWYAGLFAANQGKISNLNIKEMLIYTTNTEADVNHYVGGIVGFNSGTITNCHVEGKIITSHRNSQTGGLVGDNQNAGQIIGCSTNIVVSVSNSRSNARSYAGGIAGTNRGKIYDSFTGGDHVVASSDCESFAGGLVGINNGGTIERCYSLIGAVSASAGSDAGTISAAGGLVGSNNGGKVINCYSTTNVIARSSGSMYSGYKPSYGGGLIGRAKGGTVSGCYATGNVSVECYNYSNSSAGGLVGFVETAGTYLSCYATGKITSCSYSGNTVAGPVFGGGKKMYVGIDKIFRFTGQEFELYFDQSSNFKTEPNDGYYHTSVDMETLLQADFQNNTLGLNEDVWNFVDGSHPTLKPYAE